MTEENQIKMKLLKLFLFLGASRGQETACPPGWEAGKEKCYKAIAGRGVKLRDAGLKCKREGGGAQIFTPSGPSEIKEIKTLANKNSFGLKFNQMYVWVAYKIKNTSARKFPPELTYFDGKDAPDLFHEPSATRMYNRKVSQ